jgi:3-oxoacyl-[acyl-carrier-protein] synthase-3
VRARVLSTGIHLPDDVVDNELLSRVMPTSPGWIEQRSGIKERRVVPQTYRLLRRLAAATDRDAELARVRRSGLEDDGPIVSASDLGVPAAQRALEAAGLSAADVDLVVMSSTVPEFAMPGCGPYLARKLGLDSTPVLSLHEACTGFLGALYVADAMVRSGSARRVLAVTSDTLSTSVEYSERGRDTAVLFGDGAVAAVVSEGEDGDPGVLERLVYHTDGKGADVLVNRSFGTQQFPLITQDHLDRTGIRIEMDGQAVFSTAVSHSREVVKELLAAASLPVDEIAMLLIHQANIRICDAVARLLKLPRERVPTNLERLGNTGGASVGILLHEQLAAGNVRPGDRVVLAAMGAGFSWGAALLRW